jgi:hypothetical protein
MNRIAYSTALPTTAKWQSVVWWRLDCSSDDLLSDERSIKDANTGAGVALGDVVLSEFAPDVMSGSRPQPGRGLSPALFPAWQNTCRNFGTGVAAGPGVVALVGPPGSGKTYTLLAFSAAVTRLKANLRLATQSIQPGTDVDLVDNVDAETLVRMPPFQGVRAVAIQPKHVACLMRTYPNARVVDVLPMSSRDALFMIEVRRPQMQLPVGSFTLKALSRLDQLCGGNPRRLDDLLFRAFHLFEGSGSMRIAVEHVEQAARELAVETMEEQGGSPFYRRGFDPTLIDQDEAWPELTGQGGSPPPAQPAAPAILPPMRKTHAIDQFGDTVEYKAPKDRNRVGISIPAPQRWTPTREVAGEARTSGFQPQESRSGRRKYLFATAAVVVLAIGAVAWSGAADSWLADTAEPGLPQPAAAVHASSPPVVSPPPGAPLVDRPKVATTVPRAVAEVAAAHASPQNPVAPKIQAAPAPARVVQPDRVAPAVVAIPAPPVVAPAIVEPAAPAVAVVQRLADPAPVSPAAPVRITEAPAVVSVKPVTPLASAPPPDPAPAIVTPPPVSAAVIEPVVAPTPPVRVAVAPAARPPAPAAPSPASRAMLETLQRRGDEMLVNGDVSAARRLFERGVAARSARATFTLARTYDPGVLSGLGVKGVASDIGMATRLYREAIGLGSEEARAALDRLLALPSGDRTKPR